MKRNKLIIHGLTIAILTIFLAQITYAQYDDRHRNAGQHKEKIKSHKIAFITDKLNLSPQEAEKFWPVYNGHEAKMENSQKEFREKTRDKAENLKDLTDDEAEEFVYARLNQEQNMLNLKKEFINELNQILPSKKILLLMEAEREFRIELMKRLAGPRDDRPGSRSDQRR